MKANWGLPHEFQRCPQRPTCLRALEPPSCTSNVGARTVRFSQLAPIGAFKLKDYGIPGLLQDSGRGAHC